MLLCIARDPGARLRDIAATPDITERSAHGIAAGLTAAGYLVKQKDGRRNRYQVQAHVEVCDHPSGPEDDGTAARGNPLCCRAQVDGFAHVGGRHSGLLVDRRDVGG